MSKYIMSFDSGTTSNRCILFNKRGEICSIAQKEFTQIFPNPGWVEQDPEEIWSVQLEVAQQALRNINAEPSDIAAIGITNQRETTIIWDKKTAKPVYNAIVWQCRRTADYCDKLKDSSKEIHKKTGLLVDPYFSATKIRWILDHIKDGQKRAKNGELLFGTVDTWLIWKLTEGRVHVTDYSNASRTMLFNINTLEWDDGLLEKLNIPKIILPKVRESSCVVGKTAPKFFGSPINIAGIAADQQSALFGEACFEVGEIKNTYGTGCFMLMNIGDRPILSENGLLTTIGWSLNNKITYALEGSIFNAGTAIQWLRDELDILDSSYDSEYLANKAKDTSECYFVPAFTGLGTPYWSQDARGMIVGLTRDINKYHITRAALDSICYQVNDILKLMVNDSGKEILNIKVDGGATTNNYLLQTQANIINKTVIRPKNIETTSAGVGFLAGLAINFWSSLDEIKKICKAERSFTCEISEDERKKMLEGWQRAIKTAIYWAKE